MHTCPYACKMNVWMRSMHTYIYDHLVLVIMTIDNVIIQVGLATYNLHKLQNKTSSGVLTSLFTYFTN